MTTISISSSAIATILANAKNGGQFASIEGETEVKLNKYPTDGSERIRIADGFMPRTRFIVEYHFAQDYDKTMSKLFGAEYTAHDDNRRHIIPNVLMEYISTQNQCLIYMPTYRKVLGTTLNGVPMSEEQTAYMRRYLAPKKSCVIPYRTLSLKNVKAMTIGGVRYVVMAERDKNAA